MLVAQRFEMRFAVERFVVGRVKVAEARDGLGAVHGVPSVGQT